MWYCNPKTSGKLHIIMYLATFFLKHLVQPKKKHPDCSLLTIVITWQATLQSSFNSKHLFFLSVKICYIWSLKKGDKTASCIWKEDIKYGQIAWKWERTKEKVKCGSPATKKPNQMETLRVTTPELWHHQGNGSVWHLLWLVKWPWLFAQQTTHTHTHTHSLSHTQMTMQAVALR